MPVLEDLKKTLPVQIFHYFFVNYTNYTLSLFESRPPGTALAGPELTTDGAEEMCIPLGEEA